MTSSIQSIDAQLVLAACEQAGVALFPCADHAGDASDIADAASLARAIRGLATAKQAFPSDPSARPMPQHPTEKEQAQ